MLSFVNRSFPRVLLVLVAGLVSLGPVVPNGFAQEEKSTLPFIIDSADIVMSTRPAMMMRSDDYQDLKRKGGKNLDRIVNRITDSYFKFSLAEIQDIDQIVYATRIPDMRDPDARNKRYDVMVLKTVKDNTTGFEMVTQDVVETIEFNGTEYYEFKKPLNYTYRFAHIADDKTIVWASSEYGIEESILVGTKGPQSAEWYEMWRDFSGKPFSVAMRAKPQMFQNLPPNLAPFRKMKMAAGGADVGRKTRVKARVLCETEADAKAAVEAVEQGLEMAKQAMEAQKDRMIQQGQEAAYVTSMDLFRATKVKAVRKNVDLESVINIDFDALVPMLESTYAASKRTESMNNLRQTVLALHNYESTFGKFPASVLVHESGKKYSWRIAILPFIEQKELYDQYDFTQDWNSPHNRQVTSRMPDVFRSDSDDENSTTTSWYLLSGVDGIVDGENSRKFGEIHDGLSNTILAVEAKRNVHWAKPEDIQVSPDRGLPKLGGYYKGGFNAAMGDGSVRFISDKIDPDVLWSLYTASGGEVVNPGDMDGGNR